MKISVVLADPEYHIYEDLNTYDVPRSSSPDKISLNKGLPYEMFTSDHTTDPIENHYANID